MSDQLRHRLGLLIEVISDRYGTRVAHLVTRAADEIRREIGGGLKPGSVPIEIDVGNDGGGVWLPQAEVESWLDLFKNLLRNAVQATEDKRGRFGEVGSDRGDELPAVQVRLRLLPQESGSTLEIIDRGVGMDACDVGRIWIAGASRHGAGRGLGLTENKRSFVLSRGRLEIRSQPGVGTAVRIDFPFRDIAIPAVPLHRLQLAYVPLVVPAVVLVAALMPHHVPEVQRVRVNSTTVEAIGENGEPIWSSDLGETILTNDADGDLTVSERIDPSDALVVFRGGRDGVRGVMVATRATEGSGHVAFIRGNGTMTLRHSLCWDAPDQQHLGNLVCIWEKPVPWPGARKPVVALHVRDSNYSASSTQFFTTGFDSLGAYYHDGPLAFRAATDMDGDGRPEVLLFGVNDHARKDLSIVPRTQTAYLDCLVLLEVPQVNGQAYPWELWAGMPHAEEEGYLILTPLRDEVRPCIRRIDIAKLGPGGVSQIEVALQDGRIYRLNERLRPLACTAGDFTQARTLAPTRPIAPLVYFRRGKRESIDLVVE